MEAEVKTEKGRKKETRKTIENKRGRRKEVPRSVDRVQDRQTQRPRRTVTASASRQPEDQNHGSSTEQNETRRSSGTPQDSPTSRAQFVRCTRAAARVEDAAKMLSYEHRTRTETE